MAPCYRAIALPQPRDRPRVRILHNQNSGTDSSEPSSKGTSWSMGLACTPITSPLARRYCRSLTSFFFLPRGLPGSAAVRAGLPGSRAVRAGVAGIGRREGAEPHHDDFGQAVPSLRGIPARGFLTAAILSNPVLTAAKASKRTPHNADSRQPNPHSARIQRASAANNLGVLHAHARV